MAAEDQPDETASLPPGCALWSGWFLASLLGGFIGWYVGWRASFLAPGWLATWIIGAIIGAISGGLQALVLYLNGRPAALWFLSTIFGWAAGFFSGAWFAQFLGLTDILFGLVTGGVVGVCLGFFQWLVLRRWVDAAVWWIPASVFAWTSSLLYYQPGASALGLLYGAISGIVTATILLWLLHRPTNEM